MKPRNNRHTGAPDGAAAVVDIDWTSNKVYADKKVNLGDKFRLTWTGNHDVCEHVYRFENKNAFENCDFERTRGPGAGDFQGQPTASAARSTLAVCHLVGRRQ